MTPYYSDDSVTLFHGDCLDMLRELPDNSVDSVVTDPPYGLGFMGREWDDLPPGIEFAAECLRVLKPGGHMLAFGGSRTWHRLTCAVEDAGFEIRDSIAWLYGSGFPKSLDVSKAIDKRGGNAHLAGEIAAAIKKAREDRGWTAGQADRHFCGGSTNWTWYEGRKGLCRPPTPADFARIAAEWPELAPLAEQVAEAEREKVGEKVSGIGTAFGDGQWASAPAEVVDITAPSTSAAQRWQGWGTALKPAFEPIVVARKPLAGTVAGNVLAWGTGALNVDGCRIQSGPSVGGSSSGRKGTRDDVGEFGYDATRIDHELAAGRWPANVVLDESQAAELDAQSGTSRSPSAYAATVDRSDRSMFGIGGVNHDTEYGDSGGASRFFPTFRYQPKASSNERPRVAAGGETAVDKWCGSCGLTDLPGLDCQCETPKWIPTRGDVVAHPTVKPLDLMRWLVRLVTPPGGTVLEPFAGSGTTAEACVVEGFKCVAIEREADYLPLIVQRLTKPIQVALDFDSL